MGIGCYCIPVACLKQVIFKKRIREIIQVSVVWFCVLLVPAALQCRELKYLEKKECL